VYNRFFRIGYYYTMSDVISLVALCTSSAISNRFADCKIPHVTLLSVIDNMFYVKFDWTNKGLCISFNGKSFATITFGEITVKDEFVPCDDSKIGYGSKDFDSEVDIYKEIRRVRDIVIKQQKKHKRSASSLS